MVFRIVNSLLNISSAFCIPLVIWGIYVLEGIYESGVAAEQLTTAEVVEITNLKSTLFILLIVKSLFYILTAVGVNSERKILIDEIENAPLMRVDETLNNDLYKNILEQSKYPDDHSLVLEYKRLTISNKSNNKSSKVEESHNETRSGNSHIINYGQGLTDEENSIQIVRNTN